MWRDHRHPTIVHWYYTRRGDARTLLALSVFSANPAFSVASLFDSSSKNSTAIFYVTVRTLRDLSLARWWYGPMLHWLIDIEGIYHFILIIERNLNVDYFRKMYVTHACVHLKSMFGSNFEFDLLISISLFFFYKISLRIE